MTTHIEKNDLILEQIKELADQNEEIARLETVCHELQDERDELAQELDDLRESIVSAVASSQQRRRTNATRMKLRPTDLRIGDLITVTLQHEGAPWVCNGKVTKLDTLIDGGVEVYAGLEYNSAGTIDFYADDEYVSIERWNK